MTEQLDNEVSGIGLEGRPRNLVILVALMVLVGAIILAAFWPVLSCKAFSFDDEQYLLENELVQNPSWKSAGRFLSEILWPSTVRGYYQPLAMISLMLDYAVGARLDNLTPFRRTSLLLHTANSLLLIVFLYLLFGCSLPAAMVGLLYGVHPLTIESIPWLAERKTLLAAFFVLWCLVFYIRFCRSGNIKTYCVCMVLFVLALMSKPTSIPLPLLMLVLDYWPLKRLNKKAVAEKIPFLLVGGIAAIITFVSQKNTAHVVMPSEQPLFRIPLMICYNLIFYLYKFVWPVRLSAFYPFPTPFTPKHPMVLAGIIGTCILLALLLVSLLRTRALLAGWLFFFLAVLPTLGIIGFHPVIAADRHIYLPMVGFLLPLAGFLTWFCRSSDDNSRHRDITVLALVLVLCSAEIVAVRRYLIHWRDTVTHYKYMLSLSPDYSILHNNLALALVKLDKTEEAVEHYRTSLQLKPNSAEVHNNLANALITLGQTDKALEHYKKALHLKPKFAEAHYNLAVELAKKASNDEAIDEYHRALKIKPDYVNAWSNLGFVLAEQGSFAEAVDCYKKAVEFKPDDIITHGRLALALAELDKIDEAIKHCRIVLKARPDDIEMHCNIGILLQRQGKIPEAISHYQQALQINPEYAKARNLLKAALDKQKNRK